MANWRHASVVGLGLFAGCGGDDGGLATGTLAYGDVDGALAIVDLATGASRTIPVAEGAPFAIALSPDAAHIAFAVDRGDRGRSVHATDRDGPPAEIDPGTGSLFPAFAWGDGYFRYGRYNAERSEHVVLAGQATSRRLGDAEPREVVLSPTDAVLAYAACIPPAIAFDCPSTLTIERADGTPVAATELGGGVDLLAFTPAGDAVVTIERVDDVAHLGVRALDALDVHRDLGPVDAVPYGFDSATPRTHAISPDGREIVALRDGALVAIDLGDGASRVIAADPGGEVASAVFAPTGDVVYRIDEELPPLDDDIGEYRYHLWVGDATGAVAVATAEVDCFNSPTLSPSGALAAWSCGGEVIVMSLAARTIVQRIGGDGFVAGFTRDDRGLVVAFGLADSFDRELAYVPIGGAPTPIAIAGASTSSGGAIESPSYSYVP